MLYTDMLNAITKLDQSLKIPFQNAIYQLKLSPLKLEDVITFYLLPKHPISIGDICDQGIYRGTNCNHSFNKIENEGYIIRTRCELDKRIVVVERTPKGNELCRQLDHFIDKANDSLKTLTDDNFIKQIKNITNHLKTF